MSRRRTFTKESPRKWKTIKVPEWVHANAVIMAQDLSAQGSDSWAPAMKAALVDAGWEEGKPVTLPILWIAASNALLQMENDE